MSRVAVVIPCFEHKRFLAGAIESALAQSVKPAEIIVVDDGSTDHPEAVTAAYPMVKLVCQPHGGLSAARNTGLHAATSSRIIFLDADDRLLPDAVAAGLRCFNQHPHAGFVYGAYREARRFRETRRFRPASARRDLLRCNWIGMIASVMFNRDQLIAIGGFDQSLGMCEDWDVYLRLARTTTFVFHHDDVARYVRHRGNMSNNIQELRKWIEVVRQKERERGLSDDETIAWNEGSEIIDAAYATRLQRAARTLAKLRRPRAP